MALTATDKGFAVGGGVASSYVFASFSPTASTWLVIDVGNDRGSTPATTPTLSGGGLTYTQEATVIGLGGSALNDRITRFTAWTGSSPGSFQITVDFGGVNQQNCGLHVTEIAGGDSADIIVQNVTGASSAGSPATVTLAAFGSSNNRPIVCVLTGDGGGNITPEASYTEIRESNIVTSECEMETEWLDTSADTTSTATFAAGNWAIIGSELKAASTVTTRRLQTNVSPRRW